MNEYGNVTQIRLSDISDVSHTLHMAENRSESEQQILIRFGERLRELRKERGLSQLELSLKGGYTRSYLTEVELGKRNVSLLGLYKLAEVLEVNVTDLIVSDASESST